MGKIRKNLSDQDMLVNWHEETTFENSVHSDIQSDKPLVQPAKKPATDLSSAFFTPELQDKVGKALLELKLKLYKEGIVDYHMKVTCEDGRVILAPVPDKPKSDVKSQKS